MRTPTKHQRLKLEQAGLEVGRAGVKIHYSEGGYGINIQVEKSKNMTIVKFMECDLNQLF